MSQMNHPQMTMGRQTFIEQVKICSPTCRIPATMERFHREHQGHARTLLISRDIDELITNLMNQNGITNFMITTSHGSRIFGLEIVVGDMLRMNTMRLYGDSEKGMDVE